jgi:hypothetical protein
MQNNDEVLTKEWLDECRTESTREAYAHYIKIFQAWYGKPLAQFLKLPPKDMRHVALRFQNEQASGGMTKRNKPMKTNTIISMMTALGSFCSQNGKTLPLRGKRLRIQIDLDSHVFTNGDLASMFDVGTVQEKAILATMTSLGWEVGAVISLKRAFIQDLIQKASEDKQKYVYFRSQRQKTGALRLGVLNPLALEWLEKWFNEWQGERIFEYTTKEGINSMMRRLVKDIQIKKTGRIHSHLIRKWVMSGLSRAGFNDFQIKYLMGKAIPVSDATYLQTLQQEIEDRYPKAYEQYLNLKPSKISTELTSRLDQLEQENSKLKERLDSVKAKEAETEKQKEELDAFKARFERMEQFMDEHIRKQQEQTKAIRLG